MPTAPAASTAVRRPSTLTSPSSPAREVSFDRAVTGLDIGEVGFLRHLDRPDPGPSARAGCGVDMSAAAANSRPAVAATGAPAQAGRAQQAAAAPSAISRSMDSSASAAASSDGFSGTSPRLP